MGIVLGEEKGIKHQECRRKQRTKNCGWTYILESGHDI